jgi:ferritin-like protein
MEKKYNIENLKPFKKGQSGNPKGYQKGVPNAKTRLKNILSIIQKKENKLTQEVEDLSIAEQMDIAIIDKALQGDVKAYQEIFDRLDGKTTQTIDLNNNITGDTPVEKWLKS